MYRAMVATGWTTRAWFPAGAGIFFSSPRPYRFWGPPSLLFNGYRWFFTPG